MTRKIWLLIALAVLLGAFSLYLNQDWFRKADIQIYHRSRPARLALFRRKRGDDSPVNPIIFGFDRKLRLNLLKVIPLSDIKTNKYPHPIWYLVSESNSVPIKDFSYGMSIQGMHPAIKDTNPEPLEPGTEYRLVVQAGTFKGEHDFVPVPKTP